jgi:hypothetical protein
MYEGINSLRLLCKIKLFLTAIKRGMEGNFKMLAKTFYGMEGIVS